MSTPTVALFYEDDYAREMDATLMAVEADGVVLDQTVFYPRSGNQDTDIGGLTRLGISEQMVSVIEVTKDELGVIRHRLDIHPDWTAGIAVHGTLDWARRLTLMRLHTAQHLVSRWFLDHQHNATERADIMESGCIIELARPTTVDDALSCQDDLNDLISAGRPVRRLNTDGYLEIVVEGYDRQPCGGTHVANVAEIEQITLIRVRRNRIEFQVAARGRTITRHMAAAVLSLAPDLETDVVGFEGKARAVLEELRGVRVALVDLRDEVAKARVARTLALPYAEWRA